MTRQATMIGFHDAVVGRPKEVADTPEELFAARVGGGFVIAARTRQWPRCLKFAGNAP
jgi:alkanesulfonate monooxygenase SsuD/methylene tetrahydromethanopterin reductase-like flavin-dependent oxidoreductase (luciferase family)